MRLPKNIAASHTEAIRLLGKLDGITELLPDKDWFLMMFIQKDASRSSQIERTNATMMDVIERQNVEPRITLPEFVPPPVHEMNQALNDLENFIHADDDYLPLIKAGLLHAQFETIHPFTDGNGRTGRMLITMFFFGIRNCLRCRFCISLHFLRNISNYIMKSLMDIIAEWRQLILLLLKKRYSKYD